MSSKRTDEASTISITTHRRNGSILIRDRPFTCSHSRAIPISTSRKASSGLRLVVRSTTVPPCVTSSIRHSSTTPASSASTTSRPWACSTARRMPTAATSHITVRTGPSVPLITTTAATSLSTMVLTTVPSSSVPTIVSTGSTPVLWATRLARRSSSNRSRNMSTCSSSVTVSVRSVTTVPTSAAGSMLHSGPTVAVRFWA